MARSALSLASPKLRLPSCSACGGYDKKDCSFCNGRGTMSFDEQISFELRYAVFMPKVEETVSEDWNDPKTWTALEGLELSAVCLTIEEKFEMLPESNQAQFMA